MPKIKVEGIEELKIALKENVQMKHVKSIIKFHGGELQEKIVRNADFKGHWGWKKGVGRAFIPPTGKTKETITLELKDGGMTADAGATTEYSGYVEWGTRFMDAQPFVGPAFEKQKKQFKKDLQRLSK
jgi:HK97 gp10 family phage protein